MGRTGSSTQIGDDRQKTDRQKNDAIDLDTFDDRLQQINQRLKLAQLGVQIERRGHKLNLRATLPPRPGCGRLRSHQQRLSLNLPINATGLKQAEQEAKVIAVQLMQNIFDWKAYLPVIGGGQLRQMDLAEKLRAFQYHFFASFEDPSADGFGRSPILTEAQLKQRASAKTTWETAYAPYLRKLEAIAEARSHLALVEAIYATVQAIPQNSRGRQVCCTALTAFAEFLNLELPEPLKQYWGNYSPSQTQLRQLPTDEQIIEVFSQIPNPAWRFVYGVMATYGLRNHEVFFADYRAIAQDISSPIEVLDTTKTGSHEVWAFPPEWVERFDLQTVFLPHVNVDLSRTTLQRIGQQVSRQFRRYGIPFSPYDLRHAWAVRTIHVGLPDSVAARMMGHSVAIHTKTYHRWITRRDQQRAVDAALQKT
jgi:integrase